MTDSIGSLEVAFASLAVLLTVLLSKRPRFRIVILTMSIFFTVRYFAWRTTTLNHVDIFGLTISVSLLASEFFGIVQYLLFLLQSNESRREAPMPAAADSLPSVDVFITVYNEPIDILTRTIIGCKALEYPAQLLKVHVLDDGRRDEVKELCARYRCGYITRADNAGAKAGNINNALGQTSGELVTIFDCDHVPVASFLMETVLYFTDPQMGFVQTPHHFYNSDIFQYNLRLQHEVVGEQDLFFKIIQPGKDFYNSAFFAGSAGVLRRNALAAVGGFRTDTVTEDLHTSMQIHSRGYRSAYVNKVLSVGLAPETAAAYVTQRKRWTEGGIQVFLLDNPLFKKGLSLAQKLCYFSSVLYFFHWLPRLVFLLTPLASLLAGYAPVVATTSTLLLLFIPHYVVQVGAFTSISKNYRSIFWNDVYETFMCFALGQATVKAILKPRRRAFKVTPKGLEKKKSSLNAPLMLPHAVLICLYVIGVGSGAYRVATGAVEAGFMAISMAWATYNTFVVVAALLTGFERKQVRRRIRVPRRLACELDLPSGKIECVTKDINDGGLCAYLPEPLKLPGGPVNVTIRQGPYKVSVMGEIVRQDIDNSSISMGIKFVDLGLEEHAALVRLIHSPADAWAAADLAPPVKGVLHVLAVLFTVALRRFMREKVLKRISPRFALNYSCVVSAPSLGALSPAGVTNNMSFTGLCAEVGSPVALPSKIRVNLSTRAGGAVELSGMVVWQIRKKDGKVVFGMSFDRQSSRQQVAEVIGCEIVA